MFFQILLCLLSHGSLSEVQVSEPPSLNCKRIINFFIMYSLYRDSAFLMLPTLMDILEQVVHRADEMTEKLRQLSRQRVLMVQVLFCQEPHRWLGGDGLSDALDREGQRLARLWHKGRPVRTAGGTVESAWIRPGSEDKGRKIPLN